MKFVLERHIVGKVYDLFQENMNAMIQTIEMLLEENQLLSERFSDMHQQLLELEKESKRDIKIIVLLSRQ